jgi:hypothetical protein
MSNAIITALTGGMNTLNTALTAAFAADSVQCFLLKRAENSETFTEIREVTSGFFYDRDQSKFDFAPLLTDTTFHDHFTSAGFIAYGAGATLQIFEIDAEQKDETKSDASSPFYMAIVTRTKERYAPVTGIEDAFTVGGNYLTIGGQSVGI